MNIIQEFKIGGFTLFTYQELHITAPKSNRNPNIKGRKGGACLNSNSLKIN